MYHGSKATDVVTERITVPNLRRWRLEERRLLVPAGLGFSWPRVDLEQLPPRTRLTLPAPLTE
jgi:hypothetical protein